MAIKPVIRMGTKPLSEPSLMVGNLSKQQLTELLKDMHDTMLAKDGVGIAAPQIGVYVRVIMFGFEHNDRYPDKDAVPFTILINPSYEPLSDHKEDDWEGCLSVPGLRGLVSRYTKINYSGHDPEGNFISREAEGFHARVVQHEVDHINGFLYLSRMNNMQFLGFEEEVWERIYKKKK
jgi:peptide deformylase